MIPGKLSFLISGCHCSGSDILTAMLRAHPDVQMPVEGHYEHLFGRVPETAATISARLRGFRAACEEEAKVHAKVWGNKIATDDIGALTPNALCDDKDAIQSFLSEMGDLKHIFVIRDGRACVRSMLLHESRPIDVACRSWLFSIKLLRSSRQRRLNGMVVKFEELAANPVLTVRGICDFIGLEYVPGMLSNIAGCDLDQQKMPVSPLPSRITRQMESGLRYCRYLDATKSIPRHAVRSLHEASLLSELREEVAVLAQQLSYQKYQRRIEVEKIAGQACEEKLRFSANIASREEQLTNADRDIRRLVRELDELEERLRSADRDIRNLVSEVEDREGRLRNADRDIRRLMPEVEDREERLRNADRDIRNLVSEVEDREERLRNADWNFRRLMRELKDREGLLRKADRDMRSLICKVEDREERLRSADRDIRDLIREVQDREERLRSADRDIRRLMPEVEDREARLKNADRDMRSLILELENRDERLSNADRDIRNFIREVEGREERLTNADQDIRNLISELADRDRKLAAADQDLRRLATEIGNQGQRLAAAENELADGRRQMQRVESSRLARAVKAMRRLKRYEGGP